MDDKEKLPWCIIKKIDVGVIGMLNKIKDIIFFCKYTTNILSVKK
jgi:hypothetical protein